MPIIQHIRYLLPTRKGNSFYRDKTDYSRFVSTYCGADVTAYDVNRNNVATKKARAFYEKNGGNWQLCHDCKLKAGLR